MAYRHARTPPSAFQRRTGHATVSRVGERHPSAGVPVSVDLGPGLAHLALTYPARVRARRRVLAARLLAPGEELAR